MKKGISTKVGIGMALVFCAAIFLVPTVGATTSAPVQPPAHRDLCSGNLEDQVVCIVLGDAGAAGGAIQFTACSVDGPDGGLCMTANTLCHDVFFDQCWSIN